MDVCCPVLQILSLTKMLFSTPIFKPNRSDFAGDKDIAFDFSDACPFRHPVYFDYQYFLGFISDLRKVIGNALTARFKTALLDLSSTFCSSVVSKPIRMFHQFPLTNKRRHLFDRKNCIYYQHASIGAIP